jgi:hypothetical protein
MKPDNSRRTKVLSVWNVLKILLAVGLSFFVLSKTNLPDLVETLRNGSIPWLVVSTVLFVLLTLLKTLQYYILLRSELSYLQVLNLIIWQNVIANFFLTGAGVATYITMTRVEHEIKISRSVTVFLLTKAGDLTAIWSVLLVAAGFLWPQLGALQTPVLLLILVIGIAVLAFFLTILLRQRFVSFLKVFFERTKLSRFGFVAQALNTLQEMANMDQVRLLRIIGALTLCSFIYLGVTLVWNYANLAIFNLFMQPMPFVFVLSLIQLVSYIPIAVFGGLGITESSSLYFWSFFDVTAEVLVPVMVGVRVVFYMVNLIPLIYLPLYAISHGPKKNQTHERQEP